MKIVPYFMIVTKEVLTVIDNNSTNLTEQLPLTPNNYLSPQMIEHKKTMTYADRNPGTNTNVARLNQVMASQFSTLSKMFLVGLY